MNDLKEADVSASKLLAGIVNIAPNILYIFDLKKMSNVWSNRSVFAHLGYDEAELIEMGDSILAELMHPDDFARYPAHFENLIALGPADTAEFEYRMRHRDGHWVWLHSQEAVYTRGPDDFVEQIIGSAHDITELKTSVERVTLVTEELRHRVKNIFTVSTSLLSLAARRRDDPQKALVDARDRILALAKANEVALEEPAEGKLDVRTMVRQTLEPYKAHGTIECDIAPIMLVGQQATPVGLIVHELATNAAKYGGLRNTEGKISVSISATSETVVMIWEEVFCPPIDEALIQAATDGFGSRLIKQAAMQLDGVLERELLSAGLKVTLRFPKK